MFYYHTEQSLHKIRIIYSLCEWLYGWMTECHSNRTCDAWKHISIMHIRALISIVQLQSKTTYTSIRITGLISMILWLLTYTHGNVCVWENVISLPKEAFSCDYRYFQFTKIQYYMVGFILTTFYCPLQHFIWTSDFPGHGTLAVGLQKNAAFCWLGKPTVLNVAKYMLLKLRQWLPK